MMYFINGSYLSEEEAKLSIRDLSILRGFGVFDFLKTYHQKPFHLKEHLLRLRYSAEGIGLQLPYSLEEIESIVAHLLAFSKAEESAIKLLVTGGVSSDQFTPTTPSFIAFVYPLTSYPPELYLQGVPVVSTHLARSFPTYKTLQYLPGIVAVQQGQHIGAKEALYISSKGLILEGVTSNFFGIKQGVLHTCLSEEVLAGITREVVLQRIATDLPISSIPITYEEIPLLEEAFITASNKEIMPVTQIDHALIGDGKVGKITKNLIEKFKKYTTSQEWLPLEIPRYLDPPPIKFLRQTSDRHATLVPSVRQEAK